MGFGFLFAPARKFLLLRAASLWLVWKLVLRCAPLALLSRAIRAHCPRFNMSKRSQTDECNDATAGSAQTGRSVISLLLAIHWCVIFVVLAANLFPRSVLLDRLAGIMRPYAGTLHLDPDGQTYHLTHPSEIHDDHLIEVLPDPPAGAEPKSLLKIPPRYAPSFQRHKMLARTLATFGYLDGPQADSRAGELAKAIGGHVIFRQRVPSVTVRCRHHRIPLRDVPPAEAANNPPDPYHEAYFDDVYQARVWRADDGSIQVLKTSGRGEVAAPDRDGE